MATFIDNNLISPDRPLQTHQIKSNQTVRPKVDQRAGQLSLSHVGITKIEKNRTKT